MIRAVQGMTPQLDPGCFVHDAAEVLGMVRLGDGASVWPGAVIRADTERVEIGARSNVQDGVVIHADPGFPCIVGREVTIGHNACLHGCAVEDGALIGIGAIVLNGARVGAGAIIGAGALVPEGVEIPAASLALGAPARVRREVDERERGRLRAQAGRYVDMIAIHRPENP